jgi:hypothetical protein
MHHHTRLHIPVLSEGEWVTKKKSFCQFPIFLMPHPPFLPPTISEELSPTELFPLFLKKLGGKGRGRKERQREKALGKDRGSECQPMTSGMSASSLQMWKTRHRDSVACLRFHSGKKR